MLLEFIEGVGTLWSWREESNLRPAVYKTAALPTELRQLEEFYETHHTKGYLMVLGGSEKIF